MKNLKRIERFLSKAGLAAKESKAYLYLVGAGPQTASALAKACGLTRTSAYDIIRKLESRGMCFSLGGEYGKKISATRPVDLADIFADRERELKALTQELNGIMPLFEAINNNAPKKESRVSYFSGRESLRKLIRLSLQSANKKIYWAGSEMDIAKSLGLEFLTEYHERRAKKNILLKALRPGKLRAQGLAFNDDREYKRLVRLRPEGLIKLKSVLIIWDSAVALCSLDDDAYGLLIESEALSIMMASWFDFIWEKSKDISHRPGK